MKLESRVVELFGEINEELAHVLTGKLHRLDNERDIRIILAINSPGGSTGPTEEIVKTIKNMITPVYGVVIGKAHSSAFVILQNCEERVACSDPHVSLMFHPGTLKRSIIEKADLKDDPDDQKFSLLGEFKDDLFHISTNDASFVELLDEWAKRSDKTAEALKEYSGKVLSPQLALELGLLDGLDKYLQVAEVH